MLCAFQETTPLNSAIARYFVEYSASFSRSMNAASYVDSRNLPIARVLQDVFVGQKIKKSHGQDALLVYPRLDLVFHHHDPRKRIGNLRERPRFLQLFCLVGIRSQSLNRLPSSCCSFIFTSFSNFHAIVTNFWYNNARRKETPTCLP